MEKIPFTPAGLEKIKTELVNLKGPERHEVIRAIADAREHGDLSENAEYHAARERQSFIEGRITELEDVTSRAEVVDLSRLTGQIVTFGTEVVVADEITDEEATYVIDGPYEAVQYPLHMDQQLHKSLLHQLSRLQQQPRYQTSQSDLLNETNQQLQRD